MSELTNILGKLKKVAESVKTEIQALDEQINQLNHERQALIDAPVSRADYAAYVKADISRRCGPFLNQLRRFARGGKTSGANLNLSFGALERVHNAGQSQQFPYMNGDECFDGFNISPGAFYWYFGDLIAERFMDAMDTAHAWQEGGMPIDERRKRIAEIDQQMDELISKRDELASQLTSAGITE
ncbi:MAG: hypothetical protein F9K30_00215 [Dechloromonas sp.]|nr:MAG: hypothetical protein F9K30_00215 [Dechloromonas sp.]